MGSSPEKWMAVADLHGDKQHKRSVAAALDFARQWKPKHRIHLGDNWDFRWLRGAAGEDDRLDQHIQDDFDAGYQFLRDYKPTHFLWGNHDWRVVKGTDSPNGPKAAFCEHLQGEMEDAIGRAAQTPYNKRDGILQFGDIKIMHGYAAGVGAVRKHALIYGRSMMGHLHTNECVTTERWDRAACQCVGCLCELELGYNEQQIGTLRQEHGFAYGLLWPNGRTLYWIAREVDGAWYLPSEMREVRHAD